MPEEIKIIYEDNHILVVEKPINVLSQSDITGDADLLTILKNDLKQRYNKPGNVYLGLVHRLDRPVGGVMVFAKTSKAASRLSEQIRTGNFKKTYLAVLQGRPSKTFDTLEHYLEKDEASNTVKAVAASKVGAKRAVLDYELLGSFSGLSLVKINLHTGRSHQIRVQVSEIGFPLFGDQKYGTVQKPGQQIALWSHKIMLIHPILKETREYTSLPPKIFPWELFSIV